jgi:hypothetical protein
LQGGSFRRVLRTRALRRGELPRTASPVTGRLRSPPYPAAAPASNTARPTRSRQVRQKPGECHNQRAGTPRIIRAGPSSLNGASHPLRGTRLRRAVDPGDLCQPSGPDGEGQAGGQARKARGEPQHLSEGWTGPSQLGVKPCGHAESFAMLPSWLPQKLLIMNHFELNYKRH